MDNKLNNHFIYCKLQKLLVHAIRNINDFYCFGGIVEWFDAIVYIVHQMIGTNVSSKIPWESTCVRVCVYMTFSVNNLNCIPFCLWTLFDAKFVKLYTKVVFFIFSVNKFEICVVNSNWTCRIKTVSFAREKKVLSCKFGC